jgi:hypothetical protein
MGETFVIFSDILLSSNSNMLLQACTTIVPSLKFMIFSQNNRTIDIFLWEENLNIGVMSPLAQAGLLRP